MWVCADGFGFAVVVIDVTMCGGADTVMGVDSCFARNFAVAMLRSEGEGLHLHEEVMECVFRNVCGMMYLFRVDL